MNDTNDSDLPRNGAGDADSPQDKLFAYIRGELDVEKTRALAAELAANPALREELEWMRALVERATLDHVEASADAAFSRLQATLNAAVAAAHDEATPARRRPGLLQRVKDALRVRAPTLQPALLFLVLVQAGALGYLINGKYDQSEAPQLRGGVASCLDVWITPRPDAGVQALRDWLLQYSGSVAAGPDPQGRFRIALPDADARMAFIHDPAATRIALRVEDVTQCSPPAH